MTCLLRVVFASIALSVFAFLWEECIFQQLQPESPFAQCLVSYAALRKGPRLGRSMLVFDEHIPQGRQCRYPQAVKLGARSARKC